MVYKISMVPENGLTQLISAPDLSRAREIARGIEERYESVEEFDGRAVRFFMLPAYADGFVERFIETKFDVSPSLWQNVEEEWRGFSCFEAYHCRPQAIEALMGIAPEECVFVPWREDGLGL